MTEEEITYIIKMRDEASKVLQNVEKELRDTGVISKDTANQLRGAADGFNEMAGDAKKAETSLQAAGKRLAEFASGAVILRATQQAVKETLNEFSLFDSGLADVRKTSGIAGEDLNRLGGEIITLSENLATSSAHLTDFAATAGRAGITGEEELLKFTSAAAEMQLALDNIDPEAFLRFLGNTSTPITDIKKVAAALNALDDTSKTSADRIQFLATDISAAGAMFKFAAEDVLAWSTILAETGVDSGVASTTILRLGDTIRKAALLGGQELTVLSEVAGLTTDQFKALSDSDPAQAINAIIGGLSKLDGIDQNSVLELFELDAIQSSKGINPLIAKYEQLEEARRSAFDTDANEARFANEIEVQLQKYENVTQQFQVSIDNLQAAVGEDFADVATPVIIASTEALQGLLSVYRELPDGAQKFIAGLVVTTATMVGGLLVIGKLGVALTVTRALLASTGVSATAAAAGMTTHTTATTVATGATRVFSVALRAIPFIGLAAGAIALATELYNMSEATEEAANMAKELDAYNELNTAAEAASTTQEELVLLSEAAILAAFGTDEARTALNKLVSEADAATASQQQAGKGSRSMGDEFSIAKDKADALIVSLGLLEARSLLAARALARADLIKAQTEHADTISEARSANSGTVFQRLTGKDTTGISNSERRDIRSASNRVSQAEKAFKQADSSVEQALAESKATSAKAQADARSQITGGPGLSSVGTPAKTSGGASARASGGSGGGLSDAEKDAQDRAEALRDIELSNAALSDQIDLIRSIRDGTADLSAATDSQINVLGLTSDAVVDEVLAQQQLMDVIEATAALRAETGDNNAQLSQQELDAVLARTVIEKELSDQLQAQAVIRDASLDIDGLQEEIKLIGLGIGERLVELEVHRAIVQAKREGRLLSIDEIRILRERAQTQQDLDNANSADANVRASNEEALDARKAIETIGVDTLARRQRIAVIRAEAQARLENRSATAAETEAAREAAAANFEFDEAQRAFSESQAARLATFDAVSGSLLDFATGAKSAKDAIGDLAKSLIDLIIQYQILAPIRRAFENGGGGGGSGGGSGGAGILNSVFSLFSANGNTFENSDVTAFAKGGAFTNSVINRATPFMFNKGGSFGVLGEAGPEAIMPLKRGPDGVLGVQVQGGGATGGSEGGNITLAPAITVYVEANEGDNPAETGKMIGEAIDSKMSKWVERESRPNGMLYRSRRS